MELAAILWAGLLGVADHGCSIVLCPLGVSDVLGFSAVRIGHDAHRLV